MTAQTFENFAQRVDEVAKTKSQYSRSGEYWYGVTIDTPDFLAPLRSDGHTMIYLNRHYQGKCKVAMRLIPGGGSWPIPRLDARRLRRTVELKVPINATLVYILRLDMSKDVWQLETSLLKMKLEDETPCETLKEDRQASAEDIAIFERVFEQSIGENP